MLSEDWKDRFIAEYLQLETRIERLFNYLYEIEINDAPHECPLGLLSLQLEKMSEYSNILGIEAELYGIDIYEEAEKLNKK